MKTNLVCVESPGKVATILKYLNSNPALASYGKFVVLASFGHVRDLAKKKLGIDVDDGFIPQYEFLADKKANLDKIRKAAKDADEVFIASDNDNEGEFIAESLRVAMNLGQNYKRIVFTEITPVALQNAIQHPRMIDENQLQSQQCRRILDRLVGFKLSPLLWKKFTSGSITLSAGRVQSAVMHLIILREKEIDAFVSSSYWHFNGDFNLKIGKDVSDLEEVKMYKKDLVHKVEDVKIVEGVMKSFKNDWKVTDVTNKETRQSPDMPFITSTLQQEASSKLRLGVKQVMSLAQGLYEGGHITYMRTDSYNMSNTFKAAAKGYIVDKYGENYFSGGIAKKKAVKGAQEAHECIRVTHVEKPELEGKFSADHKALYKLIWQRSVAYLMKPAVFDELDVIIRDSGMAKDLVFKTVFKKVKFNGYLAVYDVKNETNNFAEYLKALKDGKYELICGEVRAKNTWTSPPARYNDASLVKLMEQNGIGRPSTYASILEKLFEKTYVIKTNIQGKDADVMDFAVKPGNVKSLKKTAGVVKVGAEMAKVKPTDIGLEIDHYLTDKFDYIVDKDFTANMEEDLDLIAEGKKKRLEVLTKFWDVFSADLNEELKKKEDKKMVSTESKQIDLGGKVFTVRIGPYGPLAESESNGKKTFVGLKGYLQAVKKEYLDIEKEDLEFIMSLPKKMGVVDKKDVMLLLGPYGFYLKYDKLNVKIPKFAMAEFLETKSFTIEQMKGFIEYAKKMNASKNATPKNATPKKKKTPTPSQ